MKERILSAWAICFLSVVSTDAVELQGLMTVEGRFFFDPPAYTGQNRNNGSLAMEGEIYQSLPSGSSMRAEPFFRIDEGDPNRTHADLRTCNLLYLGDQWQVVVGLDKVFWGVTEFVHLVDIINQTDVIESIDNEEKLGQPMLHISAEREWGVIDGFFLPYFRERVYPGEEGRLRGPIPIDGSSARYESAAGQTHPDFALRYSHTFANVDVGLYQFIGTSREPVMTQDKSGNLIPFYQQISQTGMDLQLIEGQWLWKVEGLYRSGQEGGEAATVLGFEYTLVNPFAMAMDVGLVGEYVYDDRSIATLSPYDNDFMLGIRCSMQDTAGTELLLGLVKDVQYASIFYTLEASRRFGDWFRLEISGLLFGGVESADPLSLYSEDSFIRLEAQFFF